MKARIIRLLAGAFAVALGAGLLQSPPLAAADEDDPPSRVARLNFSQGTVSFQPAGEGDWLTAVPNRPLITGDTLWTDDDGRAELHLGSTAIRATRNTEITLLELSDHVTQIRLAQGSLVLRIRHLDDGDSFEVDTPNLSFSPVSSGEYRVDVDPEGRETVTTVWQGRAEATAGGRDYQVLAGQQVRFSGAGALDFDIEQIGRRDAFADWCYQRDLREDRADSANYVSREMTGYEDLDDYGQWRYVANYGPVWVPAAVPVGWAPYRFGHWVWIHPWGWTWVEDEPWGFAPFHYGRWAWTGGYWCWVPGPVVVRPVYAPALVVFAGGGGFRLAVGPAVGWFPLAPGEVYVPAYRTSRVYVNNINTTNTVVNVTRITNVYNYYNTPNQVTVNRVIYVNQHVTNAVTVVSHETFINARPVARNTVQISQREIEAAPPSHVVEVTPTRTSVWGAGRQAQNLPPAAVVNRPVVARRSTPPPPRPFSERPVQPGWGGQRAVQPRTDPQTEAQPQPAPPSRVQQTERAQPPQSPPPQRTSGWERRPPTQGPEANTPPHSAPEAPPRPQPAPPSRVQETERAQPQQSPPPPRTSGWERRPPDSAHETNPPPHPVSQPPPHPLVKPAPPVQEKSPQQWQEEENKHRAWQQQQQHEKPAPPAQHPSEPPRKDEHR